MRTLNSAEINVVSGGVFYEDDPFAFGGFDTDVTPYNDAITATSNGDGTYDYLIHQDGFFDLNGNAEWDGYEPARSEGFTGTTNSVPGTDPVDLLNSFTPLPPAPSIS
ncbi:MULTISPECIES: hypothetical protein [Ponticaulis]|uniref:hypothetical protein n=1 Tax=Ponticaulis TaxID=1123044 RepID=UPI0012DF3030|nr:MULTISPECIES: hypothetical protein [Ponticaulis]|tara:strand:+ start:41150 stop:41473 length:324 start_codon:yes stop_codon:yes gene_type:complete